MTELLARDWKALMLCLFLALLVWFLVGERGGQPAAAPLLESTTGLTPTLRAR